MTTSTSGDPDAPDGTRPAGLAAAEARVEAHSASLKKELGVRDLALTQILFIVGLTWIGVAGKLGPPHVLFWLTALLLFYLPSTAVVIYLNRLMPLEGGLYQWAKLGFNQATGFMLAWNLWLYVIVFTSEIGLQAATYLSYAIGPAAAWMTSSGWFVTLASAMLLGLMVMTSTLGLSVGKWVHNTGGVFMITIFTAIILLPLIGVATGTLPAYRPFDTHVPELSLYNLNILGKMGFGALGGFEYMAILAGETKAPARSVTRSVFIAAPVIALIFVLGTSTVVAYVPNADIDLIGPIAQVLRVGYGPFGIATPLVTAAIVMTLAMRVGQASVAFTAVTRLPMVAGWDRMLPSWFSRLHPTYKTPVNSIRLVGATSFAIAVLSLVGVGHAEAFQLLFNASGIFYALCYVVMFAIPLFGLRDVSPRPPLWLRLASLSGLLMTVLYVVLSVFPIIQVESVAAFALKITLTVVIMNLVGAGIYLSARRRAAGAALDGQPGRTP
jgi:glutamate:GABA antiporter